MNDQTDVSVGTEIISPIVIGVPEKNLAFQSRGDVIFRIRKGLEEHRVQPITGAPNIGKTEEAISYVNSHLESPGKYSFIGWVQGDESGSVKSSFKWIDKRLSNLDITYHETFHKIRGPSERIYAYLHAKHEGKWLLVFDNVSKKRNSRPCEEIGLPTGTAGHIIITARQPDWPNAISMPTFTKEESIQLFSKLLNIDSSINLFREKIYRIIDIIGNFPGAIVSTAHAIYSGSMGVREYVSLLESSRFGDVDEKLIDSSLREKIDNCLARLRSCYNERQIRMVTFLICLDANEKILRGLLIIWGKLQRHEINISVINDIMYELKFDGLVNTVASHGSPYYMHPFIQLQLKMKALYPGALEKGATLPRNMTKFKFQKNLIYALKVLHKWHYFNNTWMIENWEKRKLQHMLDKSNGSEFFRRNEIENLKILAEELKNFLVHAKNIIANLNFIRVWPDIDYLHDHYQDTELIEDRFSRSNRHGLASCAVLIICVLNSIGVVEKHLDNPSEAAKYLILAINLYDKLSVRNNWLQANILCNLGSVIGREALRDNFNLSHYALNFLDRSEKAISTMPDLENKYIERNFRSICPQNNGDFLEIMKKLFLGNIICYKLVTLNNIHTLEDIPVIDNYIQIVETFIKFIEEIKSNINIRVEQYRVDNLNYLINHVRQRFYLAKGLSKKNALKLRYDKNNKIIKDSDRIDLIHKKICSWKWRVILGIFLDARKVTFENKVIFKSDLNFIKRNINLLNDETSKIFLLDEINVLERMLSNSHIDNNKSALKDKYKIIVMLSKEIKKRFSDLKNEIIRSNPLVEFNHDYQEASISLKMGCRLDPESYLAMSSYLSYGKLSLRCGDIYILHGKKKYERHIINFLQEAYFYFLKAHDLYVKKFFYEVYIDAVDIYISQILLYIKFNEMNKEIYTSEQILDYFRKIQILLSEAHSEEHPLVIKCLKLYNEIAEKFSWSVQDSFFQINFSLPISYNYFEKELEKIDSRLNIMPEDHRLLRIRGNLLLELRMYREAIEAFSRVLKEDIRDFLSMSLLATAYDQLGFHAEAIDKFSEILRFQPKNALALAKRKESERKLNLQNLKLSSQFAPASPLGIFVDVFINKFTLKLQKYYDKFNGKDLRPTKTTTTLNVVKSLAQLIPNKLQIGPAQIDVPVSDAIGGVVDGVVAKHLATQNFRQFSVVRSVQEGVANSKEFMCFTTELAISYRKQITSLTITSIKELASYTVRGIMNYLASGKASPNLSLTEKLSHAIGHKPDSIANWYWLRPGLRLMVNSESRMDKREISRWKFWKTDERWNVKKLLSDYTGIRTNEGRFYVSKKHLSKLEKYGYRGGSEEEAIKNDYILAPQRGLLD